MERFETVAGEGSDPSTLAQHAALVVAVLAALLAAATFLSDEAIKDVITGETGAVDDSARREANDVKITLAAASSVLLRVVANGNPREAQAARTAQALESRIQTDLAPIQRRLSARIRAEHTEREDANTRHLIFELAQVGLQIGIVLAGISILARRRWLLAGGGLAGIFGSVLLVVGLGI